MDMDYPADAEAFRKEIRTWLEANLPDGWLDDESSVSAEERAAFERAWPAMLAAAGWRCPSWPVEQGGRGLSVMENVVLHEELARARVPEDHFPVGARIVGPTIIQWGTEDQKREFLPKIVSGDIAWCQGFSEPNAGSDLAALMTTAVLDGDEWVINGQKIWTSRAHDADYIFLLARTDPDVPKHRGISYLLVPMDHPGIDIHPIVQIDGSADFNEVFFTNVRCPAANVVGGVNNGWRVAMSTLGFERGAMSTTSHLQDVEDLEQIAAIGRRNGRLADPTFRQRWVRQWSRVQILRINGLRMMSDLLNRTDQAEALLPLSKLAWSETHRDTMNLAIDVLGMDGQVLTGAPDDDQFWRRRGLRDYPVSLLQSRFFFSRSATIWGGTSQIQRNVVGERVLGLPKEPSLDMHSPPPGEGVR